MKKLAILTSFFILGFTSFAQQDAMVSQYMFSPMILNPAYSGSHKFYNATSLVRKQWTKWDGAPASQFISFDGPIENRKLGVGLLIGNDKIGVSNNTDIYANAAYHLDVTDKTKLSFGLRGGLSYYTAKLTQLTYWDHPDAVFQNDIRATLMPNVGFGTYLYSDKYYVGLSIPHMINYDPATALALNFKNVPKQVRHYFVTAGIAIPLNTNLVLKPSFLMKYVEGAPLAFDLNTNLLINQVIWIGGSYRTSGSIVGMVEVLATKQLRLGYAYDYRNIPMGGYFGGSHEIVVSYDFGKEAIKMKSPRFF